MGRRVAPPFMDTVAKYCKDTGKDQKSVVDSINNFAANYGEYGKNVDVMAWLWCQNQGFAPPALQASSIPFTTIDKPYLTLAQVLSSESGIGENTGFAIRGWVFGNREGKSQAGNPSLYITLADGTAVFDVNVYGKQVDTVKGLGVNMFDAVYIKNCQKHTKNQDGEVLATPRLQVSGTFAETKKIKAGEYDLPNLADIGASPLADLKVYQTVLVKGMVFDSGQRSYIGCPQCKKGFKEKIAEGRPADCPGNAEKKRASCGEVIATKFTWTEIQINDMTGELTMSFSPDFNYTEEQLKNLRMKTVVAIGYLEPDSNKLNARYLNTEDNFTTMMKGTTVAPNPQVSSVTTNPVTLPTASVTSVPTTMPTVTASQPAPTATTSEVIASSLPPTSAVAPVLESWLRLMGPKTEAEIMKFLNEKKKIAVQAVKNTIKEMLDIGAIVDDQGKLRLA